MVKFGFAGFAVAAFSSYRIGPEGILRGNGGRGAMMEPEFVITDIWGDPIPGVSEFDANDPLYPDDAPIYPRRFRF